MIVSQFFFNKIWTPYVNWTLCQWDLCTGWSLSRNIILVPAGASAEHAWLHSVRTELGENSCINRRIKYIHLIFPYCI